MADETKNDASSVSKKKTGVSRTPPKSEARPLGTPSPKRSHSKKQPKPAVEASSSPVNSGAEEVVDTSTASPAESSSTDTTSVNTAPSTETQIAKEQHIMSTITLTLDPKTRKSTSLVFKLPAGVRGSVRIAKTAFPGGVPPTSLNLQSDSDSAFAQPKAKLTAEERKALRKDQPKLTPAQKLAKLQERAAKLQAKIAAEATKPAEQPTA